MTIEKIKIPNNYIDDELIETDLIAFGSELKNTIAIKKREYIYLSQHNGNTFTLESLDLFKNTLKKLENFTQVKPKFILTDANTSFNITKLAQEKASKTTTEVKLIGHHIAHAFGVSMEHNLSDFIAIVCDGTGMGDDETVWGGEVFHNDKRIGTLEHQPLLGGDVANKEPLRILIGIMSKFMDKGKILNELKKINSNFDSTKMNLIWKQNNMNFNTILTSSTGRILDCISLILGYSNKNYYEGRGAMLLESHASPQEVEMFIEPKITFDDERDLFILQTTPLIEFVLKNRQDIPREKLARFAHMYLAKGLFEITLRYKLEKKIEVSVCFTGGVAYNKIITSFMLEKGVLINEDMPAGDGGISHGQIGHFLWKQKNKK